MMDKTCFLLLSCVALLSTLGCKRRSYNSSETLAELANGQTITSGPNITYGFHWNKETAARTNPSFILRNLAAQGESRKPDDNNAGPGVYLANDPFSSEGFGDTLIVVPIVPNTQALTTTGVPKTEIANPIPVLFYEYNGLMFESLTSTKALRRAAVVRDRNVIAYENVFSIYVDKSKCTNTFPRSNRMKPGQDWREYLKANPLVLCRDTSCRDAKFKNLCAQNQNGKLDFYLERAANLLAQRRVPSEADAFAIMLSELNKGELLVDVFKPNLKGLEKTALCNEFDGKDGHSCFVMAMRDLFQDRYWKPPPDILKRWHAFLTTLGLTSRPVPAGEPEMKEISKEVREKFCGLLKGACSRSGFTDLFSKRFSPEMADKELRESDTYLGAREAVLRAIYPESMATWR